MECVWCPAHLYSRRRLCVSIFESVLLLRKFNVLVGNFLFMGVLVFWVIFFCPKFLD